MRSPALLLALLLALGCAGEPAPPAAPAAPAAAPAPAAKAPAPEPKPAAPTVGSDADAALADHWLVILASKRDPAEVVPGIAAAKEEPGVVVRQILSSRFKNLMPCYAVTIADATTNKRAALDLSARLEAKGIDNYVKNAGAWVGRSEAIDAYCADQGGEAGGAAGVWVPAEAGGKLWLPLAAPEQVVAAAIRPASAPQALSKAFDAWIQPASAPPGAAGKRYRLVNAATGEERTCAAGTVAALTLGTPHFGVLQQETPPAAPTCGQPALFAELTCDGPAEGQGWAAVEEGAKIAAYAPAGGASPALVEAAEAALAAATDFEQDPADLADYGGEPVQREVTVTRWRGPGGDLALIQARRTVGNGMCGGLEDSWIGVLAVQGEGVGAAKIPFFPSEPANAAGLVDVGADGQPEILSAGFFGETSVLGAGGAVLGAHRFDYCDCAC